MRTGMFFQPAFPAGTSIPLYEVIEQRLETTELLEPDKVSKRHS